MKNISLLIPMNGIGSRFANYSSMPKPLIKVKHKEMLFWLLDNLNLNIFAKVIIPYNAILDRYNFKNLITQRYDNIDFHLISLKERTVGAAETLKIALCELPEEELDARLMIMDCDTFYFEDVIAAYNDRGEDNAIFYFVDYKKEPIFSYIKIENNFITEIKEKEKISNFANCGIFCVESGHTLKKYCSMLLLKKYNEGKEFYTSGVFDLMMKDNLPIAAINVKNFKCVGTPKQVGEFLNEERI